MERTQTEISELKYLKLTSRRLLPLQTPFFLAILGVGSAAILLAKGFFTGGPVFWALGVAFPAVLMVLYVLANWRFQFFDSTRTQVADNCYFLGFLYFLVSLSVTLAKVVRINAGGVQQIDVPQIIEGFGIALATTILGLLLRIILLQNTASLASARDTSEETLLNATNRFRDHLLSMTDNLRITQDAILGAMRDSILASTRSLETALDTAKQTITGTAETFQRSVTLAGDTLTTRTAEGIDVFKQRIESVELPVDALTKEIAPSVDALATTLRQSVETTKKLGDSMARGANRLEKVVESFSTLETALSRYAQSADAAETASTRLLGTQQKLTEMLDSFGGAVRSLEQATRSAVGVAGTAQTLAEQTATTSTRLNTIGTEVIATAEHMNVALRNADQVVDAFGDVTKQLNAVKAAVSADAESFSRSITDSRAVLQGHTSAYAQAMEEAKNALAVPKEEGVSAVRRGGFWR